MEIGTNSVKVSAEAISSLFSLASWRATNTYTQGSLVKYGSNVYMAVNGGISGTTAPTHTYGEVSDGSILWRYLNKRTSRIVVLSNLSTNNVYLSVNGPAEVEKGILLLPYETKFFLGIREPIFAISSGTSKILLQELTSASFLGGSGVNVSVNVEGGSGGGTDERYSTIICGVKTVSNPSTPEKLVASSTPCKAVWVGARCNENGVALNTKPCFLGGSSAQYITLRTDNFEGFTFKVSDATNIYVKVGASGEGVFYAIFQ